MNKIKIVFMDLAIPLTVLVVLTLLLCLTRADLLLARIFYSPDAGWPLKDARPWIDLYHYGNVPPLILALYGFCVLVFGFFSRKIAPYRKIGLFLVLFLAIGPGLIVNTVFKDHWGRPRPVEVKNFGGTETYLPVWERGTPGKDKSFPSGHAAIGYFLFAPYFFLRRQSPRWAAFFMLLGLGYGTLMGIGRMAQGGHFATDVLWACGLTYFTGLILSYMFRFDRKMRL